MREEDSDRSRINRQVQVCQRQFPVIVLPDTDRLLEAKLKSWLISQLTLNSLTELQFRE